MSARPRVLFVCVYLRFPNPVHQRLRRTEPIPEFLGHGLNCRPIRRMIRAHLRHHPYSPFPAAPADCYSIICP